MPIDPLYAARKSTTDGENFRQTVDHPTNLKFTYTRSRSPVVYE